MPVQPSAQQDDGKATKPWTTAKRVVYSLVSLCFSLHVGTAQSPDLSQPGSARLIIWPHTMATGTQNPTAGTYPLDSVSDVFVTVPPQCVGNHRCPLLVALPGGGITAQNVTLWLRPVAIRYGLLVLTTTQYPPQLLDVALRETLRRFAVDPDQLAIVGHCASGPPALKFGIANPDVFTRVGAMSGDIPHFDGLDPHNTTTQFFIDDGMMEVEDSTFTQVAALRAAGHPVQEMVEIRAHESQAEDFLSLGQWLHDSWATPNPHARPAPRRLPLPLPVLTLQAVTQLTTFWTRFFQEPDSIRTAARMRYDRSVVVPLGTVQPWTVMVDMPALAAHVPAVAADLQAAGLTAEQHDAYRLALLSAFIARNTPMTAAGAGAHSVLAQNVVFLRTHREEIRTLARAGIAHPDQVSLDGGALAGGWSLWHGDPGDVQAIGPMGIWRTP